MRRYYRDSQTGQLMYIDDPGSVYFDGYQSQQQQQQQQPGPMDYFDTAKSAYNMYSNFSGGGGAGEYSGQINNAGYIAAIIAAQHQMSKATDRRFEGQNTKDVFGGSFMTEPWQAFAYDKFGIDSPSAGESFDAAWQNKDWHNVIERGPRAAGYWVDPGRSLMYDVLGDKFGKGVASVFLPEQWLSNNIGSLFGKIF